MIMKLMGIVGAGVFLGGAVVEFLRTAAGEGARKRKARKREEPSREKVGEEERDHADE